MKTLKYSKRRQAHLETLFSFAITTLSDSIFRIRLSPALNGNKLSSTKAFSKNIECLYVLLPVVVDLDSTL
jgi:hypothetical protein